MHSQIIKAQKLDAETSLSATHTTAMPPHISSPYQFLSKQQISFEMTADQHQSLP